MSKQPHLKVLFIGGAGRSGSTLLDRLLGMVPGLVSVGEITNIWKVGFAENFPCGCGAPFSECAFWREVVAEAFPPPGGLRLEEIRSLRRRVQRGLGKLKLLSPLQSRSYRLELDRYAAVVERLLRAVSRVSGCGVVVDSSKLPSHGLVLARAPSLELHALHLVRDSRAVAHSWQRRKLRRHVKGEPEYLPRLGPAHSVLRYYSGNLPMHAVRPRVGAGTYAQLRYEQLVAEPRLQLERLLASLGVPPLPPDFLRGDSVHLTPNHMVDGNPMRHNTGEVRIEQDAAWETEMPPLDRALVRAGTLPLRLLYGYS